jgi:hypothetical protein
VFHGILLSDELDDTHISNVKASIHTIEDASVTSMNDSQPSARDSGISEYGLNKKQHIPE